MTEFLIYDMKVAALITACYMFYRLLMERETLHRLNRIVLLASAGMSLVLPLCIITLHKTVWVNDTQTIAAAPSAATAGAYERLLSASDHWWSWPLAAIIIAGIGSRLLYLAWNYLQLRRMMGACELHTMDDGTRLALTDQPIASFAWMHTIVMNRQDYLSQNSSLLVHEQAHVRLRHSYDVVFVEILTALQWFNPTAWFLRQDLRNLHEYEADASVLSQGFDGSQYIQLLMQKASGIQACALVNGIGNSQIKKRIMMMLKKKSKWMQGAKMLFLVPIAAVSLSLTARTVIDYRVLPGQEESKPVVPVAEAPQPDEKVYDICEVLPKFPNGEAALMKFLNEHLIYPKECTDSGIQGRVVVQMIIEKDGSAGNFKIVKNAHPKLDAEALRVLKLMPKWTPGRQKGQAVRCKFVFPVTFRLN